MDKRARGRRRAARILSLLPVLLIMAVIFFFSAQPVRQSSGTSDGFVVRLIRWFYPDFDALSAVQQGQLRHSLTVFVRKTAHVLEFAALGFALLLHLRALALPKAPVWAWLIGALYACSDELHQLFVPGRGPRVSDVAIDSAGLILGIAVFLLCAKLLRKRKKE